MSKECREETGVKKTCRMRKALVGMALLVGICIAGGFGHFIGPHVVDAKEVWSAENVWFEGEETTEETAGSEGLQDTEEQDADVTQMTEETTRITDLTEAFAVILQGATKEFIAGYAVDESFLMWLDAKYGDEVIQSLACRVMDQEMDKDIWYELTGNSIHVLWLFYCQDTGFQDEQVQNVYWLQTKSEKETVISFTGDFNLADDWCTTEYMQIRPNGILDCFSEELMNEMQTSDLLLMNNEFVYSDRGNPLAGKAYTFRAPSERISILSEFGADIVSLANNHTYDYGPDALMDTLQLLNDAGIAYVGAGKDLDEASKIVYYVANGKKIAIVSATEIERSTKYTKEATESSCGVLKTLHPEKFIKVIEEADKNSDYVIAVVHWGTEGSLYADNAQKYLAEKIANAGADAIIGGHPHRLQGAAFIGAVPVAFSLGNFWFSDGTLYTTLAQIIIREDGSLQLKYQPCIQKDLTTELITDKTERDDFFEYMAAISYAIGLDEEGCVYKKEADGYPAVVCYDSDTSETPVTGGVDNEGNAIDIVGNRKQ